MNVPPPNDLFFEHLMARFERSFVVYRRWMIAVYGGQYALMLLLTVVLIMRYR